MLNKIILSLLLLQVSITGLYSQRLAKGEVSDNNGQPLAFAAVLVVTAADSAFWAGATTDEKGHFAVPVPKDREVYVFARMLGFSPSARIRVYPGNDDVQARLNLTEDARLLNDVVVRGQRPLYEALPDRLVVNVSSSLLFSGHSALYVVQQTPGIVVNPNGSISANGKSGMSVMLNGRVVNLSPEMIGSYLDGLAAGSIKKMEFITNPQASVDAQGEAGIINIVTNDEVVHGFRGSVFSSAGYSWKPKFGFGGSGTYATNKVQLAAQYSFNRNFTTTHWDNFFDYASGADGTRIASYNVRHEDNTNQSLTLQADYQITPKTTVGTNFILNVRNHGYASGRPSSVKTTMTQNDVVKSYSESTYAERNRWDQYITNFNIRHAITDKTSLSADADYLYSLNHIPVDYTFNYYQDESMSLPLMESTMRSKKRTPINTYAVKVDYDYAVTKRLFLTAGVKYTANSFYNTFRLDSLQHDKWIRDEKHSSRYRYKEKIPAAYVSAKIMLSAKDELSAGLRYESTHMEIISNETASRRRFINFFPHVTLVRSMKPDKTSLSATLSRRINRPGYWDLAPFAIFLGPNVFVAGNESLRPSLSNSAMVSYTGKSLGYSLMGNFNQYTISNYQVRLSKKDNMILANAQNLDWSKSLHLTISIPSRQIARVWETVNSVTLFGEKISTDDTMSAARKIDLIGARFSSNNSFSLPRSWKLELNANYHSTTLAGTSRHLGFGTITAGVGKQIRGYIFNINANDILWGWRWNRVTTDTGFRSEMRYLAEPRVVTVTLRRNIGNERVSAVRKRSTASEEEQQRM